jgi:cell wall-associated NlpC family hydrolase
VKDLSELYDYALTFFGMPYQWGGTGVKTQDKVYGVDCSGLIQLIGKAGGVKFPHDMTAHEIMELMEVKGTKCEPQRGAFAFFALNNRVGHVGFMCDERLMISAAGGGAWCKSLRDATTRNANVKVQPISWYKHPSLHSIYMPHYKFL